MHAKAMLQCQCMFRQIVLVSCDLYMTLSCDFDKSYFVASYECIDAIIILLNWLGKIKRQQQGGHHRMLPLSTMELIVQHLSGGAITMKDCTKSGILQTPQVFLLSSQPHH